MYHTMCKIESLWLVYLLSYRTFSSFNQNRYMGSVRGYYPIFPIFTLSVGVLKICLKIFFVAFGVYSFSGLGDMNIKPIRGRGPS